jgi:hypothetical protein
MSVSSISTGTPLPFNQIGKPATGSKPAPAASVQSKDADGDSDGDTSAIEVKGLDVKA